MDPRVAIELENTEQAAGQEHCLGLEEGETLRACVLEVTDGRRVRLGLLGVQTWVRSEARLLVGQELELLVHSRGEGIQLRILGVQDVAPDAASQSREPSLAALSSRVLDPSELAGFHGQIEAEESFAEESRVRQESGALAALPLPAAPSGAWGSSRLYFTSDESTEQIVLHLGPGQTGELRVDLQVGPSGVDLRAEALDPMDLEDLRALLPEFEQTLSEMGLSLRVGALRGGLGVPPATLDLEPPRADGRPLLDEEA